MAVIGTIRNRLGFILVAFVGFALVLFILEGLLSSSSSFFRTNNDVAKIAGESITIQEFEQRVQQATDRYKQSNNIESLDNATMDQLREQVWNQTVNELIFGKEYEALGLTVSSAELFDMLQGKNIPMQVRQAFTDKNGQFNPTQVLQFLKNLDNIDDATRNQWLSFEKSLKDDRIRQKYQSLISGGIYVTSFQAKQDFIARNRTAKIRFVMQNYNTVSDSSVKIEESDLKEYYNEHKKQFRQPENARHMEYVNFTVSPSAEDKQEVENELKKLYDEFRDTKEDSAFIAQHSDVKFTDTYYKKKQLPPSLDSTIIDASAGHMVGPFLDGDHYKIVKVLETKVLPDSVKARHILLPLTNSADKDKVMARADSIKKAIKGGKKFDEMAKKYSTDQGSAVKGGDLGTFAEGMMVKPFNDACFNGKKGDMPVVQSQFGIHIIEILDQIKPSRRVKLAILDRKLEASSKTLAAVYAQANEFASSLSGGADFSAAITKKGLAKREAEVRETDKTLSGIESTREVVRWAFRAKKEETSKVFEAGDNYVIAKLTEIREKGILPFEQVKEQVKFLALKEKKSKEMMQKLSAELTGASTIDAVATKMKSNVTPAESVSFGTAGIVGIGREPEVAGTVFTLKPGQLSKPIKGNAGIFVVVVDNFTEPALPKDFNNEKNMLMSSVKQRAGYEVFVNVLKEKANVEDNRIKFY